MDRKIPTDNRDNTLSQIDDNVANKTAKLEETTSAKEAEADDVFDETISTTIDIPDSKSYMPRVPFRNKMNRVVQLASEGPMDRPRAFSDASQSSSTRQGILKKLHGKLMPEYKLPVKVFVKRDSKVLDEFDEKADSGLSSDAEFGFYADSYKGTVKHASADDLLDNTVISDAPPKPELPESYRKYLNKQLQRFNQQHGKNFDNDDEEIPEVKHEVKTGLDREDTDVTREDTFSDNETERKKYLVRSSLRRGRSSVSDLPIRSTGPVYKHFDAQFQSQLLRKELEKLRKMKHVRKNSETMKQKFESILRHKSTGDLRVRFADEVEEIEHVDPHENTARAFTKPSATHSNAPVVTESFQNHRRYGNQPVGSSEVTHPVPTSNLGGHTRRNSITEYEPRYSISSHFERQNWISSQSKENNTRNGARETVAHESRGPLSSRSLMQYRSRSASGLYRTREDFPNLGSSQDSGISRSAANLRRKHDTITKYNYNSVEQKREHVREKFERERKNRVESVSPDDASINLERDLQIAQERLMMLKQSHQKPAETGNTKTVSDNRSDEEKYASLIRRQVIHQKSSSLDSKESETSATERLKLTRTSHVDKPKADRMRLAIPDSKQTIQNSNQSADKTAQKLKRTAHVKPHVKTSVDVHRTDNVNKKGPEQIGKGTASYVDYYKSPRPSDLVDSRNYTKGATNVSNDVPNREFYKDYTYLQPGVQRDQRNDKINPSYTNVVPNRNVDSRSNSSNSKGSVDAQSSVVHSRQSSDSKDNKSLFGNKATPADIQKDINDVKEGKKVSEINKPSDATAGRSVEGLGEKGDKGQTTSGGKVVLRQCRVGADVVFGLVAVQGIPDKPNGNGYLDGQGLVTIRMIPDEQGRFGFNVKGGADQGMPIIVSRVAPNTPADNAIPRLNEGDQVLFINGRDVSQHTHEQVVMFIRASREMHSGELVIKVRPNAYMPDEEPEGQEGYEFELESFQISSGGGVNALDNSLKLLEESLESNAAIAQFEQLYRKKAGMTMNIARLDANVPKNRYRDISPYDQTRVLIKNGPNGDYINANYVNMEIPVTGIVNRYIAAQGPLPTTCVDFWQMIWEQQSTLVVMLTTEVERGRIKCHQYWPNLYETADYGHLQITCVKEEKTSSFAFREFNLTHVESQEERHISHMQYIAWPDHGVPDDPADFLDFVIKVRQKRTGVVEPIIVHCSAGIGRTGVLITMETAMCLIEANQPVHPLSIVRQMRDQRAMLIQTPNQYKFVCEAIIRCYNEGVVKPLPEYQTR